MNPIRSASPYPGAQFDPYPPTTQAVASGAAIPPAHGVRGGDAPTLGRFVEPHERSAIPARSADEDPYGYSELLASSHLNRYGDRHLATQNPTGMFSSQGAVHPTSINQTLAQQERARDLFRTVERFPSHLNELQNTTTAYARTLKMQGLSDQDFHQFMREDLAKALDGAFKQAAPLQNGQDPYFAAYANSKHSLGHGEVSAQSGGDFYSMPVGDRRGTMVFGSNSNGERYVYYRESC